jgi:uncharacterized protein
MNANGRAMLGGMPVAAHRGREPARGSPFVNSDDTPFWRRKSLAEMTDSEWESLCDGCGRCCLVKLEDADDPARTYFTDVGCRLLDGKTCRCRDYSNRTAKVKDCVQLTHRNIKRIVWLPPSCAYRLLAEGRDLYWWHPLVSGDPETVHQAGISVRGRVGACEDEVADADLEDRIVSWPLRMPKAARKQKQTPRR